MDGATAPLLSPRRRGGLEGADDAVHRELVGGAEQGDPVARPHQVVAPGAHDQRSVAPRDHRYWGQVAVEVADADLGFPFFGGR